MKSLPPSILYSPEVPAGGEVDILGVRIANRGLQEATDLLLDLNRGNGPQQFAFVNPDCLNIACKNEEYRAALGKTKEVWGDGVGLQIAGRMLSRPLKENVNGTDMFPLLCKGAAEKGVSIYLLGARPGIAQAAADNMQKQFPGLLIAGVQDGYWKPEEEEMIISTIRESGANILFVALGAPNQDLWIAKNLEKLNIPAAIGVGGLFDFYSDRIKRAPMLWRKLGIEWCWRMFQEPKRMWKRYILGNPLFLARIARQRIRENTVGPRAAGRRKWWSIRRYSLPKLKRGFDLLFSVTVLLFIFPIGSLIYLAIRLDSPGPVFFSQIRIGKGGKPFHVWKFRSMYVDAEERKKALEAQADMSGGVRFKMKKDPRVTRMGRLLRISSMDELPQLWNILKGDMSLVGPRPPIPAEVADYSLRARRRLNGVPGLTCIWQVSGRSNIPFDQQVEMDIDYLSQPSLWLDIQLLFRTIPAVLLARGAY